DLYKRYRPVLFKFIFNILRDYDLSCDILQQVFLQLYISLPTLKTNKPFKSWLFQVARNRCLDELRRKRVVRFSELDTYNEEDEVEMFTFVQDPCPLPEEIAERHDVQDRLLSAINSFLQCLNLWISTFRLIRMDTSQFINHRNQFAHLLVQDQTDL